MTTRALKTLAALAIFALLAAAIGGAVLLYPLHLAARAAGVTPKRRRSSNGVLVAAGSSLVGLALVLLGLRARRRSFADTPLHEDADYLAGVERGTRSARRSAGIEDGRMIERDRLLGRPL